MPDKTCIAAAVVFCGASLTLLAQSPAAPAFDVASVRPNTGSVEVVVIDAAEHPLPN